jgi:hypothetical protein
LGAYNASFYKNNPSIKQPTLAACHGHEKTNATSICPSALPQSQRRPLAQDFLGIFIRSKDHKIAARYPPSFQFSAVYRC